MKSMDGFERRLDALGEPPTGEDEATARFLAKFTSKEIIKIGDILVRADRGETITVEEAAFLQEMEGRPAPPLVPIVLGQPVCGHCGKQPASERDLNFGTLCDDCYDTAGGNFDLNSLSRDANGNYLVGRITR